MKTDALIEGNYRYTLDRVWHDKLPSVLWIMLNPSTADAHKDDATIKKCIAFTMRWGFGGMRVMNLFAWRETVPANMWKKGREGTDIMGPRNMELIIENVDNHESVIAAWGVGGRNFSPEALSAIFHDKNPQCLGIGGVAQPYHPLYQPYSRTLIEFPVPKWMPQ